jgi:mannose/fructose/N-acetylgalactosamine-specific phosphotransferase system component IIB
MKIALVRVDDRLIHGQVVLGWVRMVGATRIVVGDDDAAKDEMQKTLMQFAAPPGVETSIVSVDEAGAALANDGFPDDTVMVLVRGPRELVRLMAAGVPLTKVNVGNVRAAPGRERLTKEVAAGPEDLAAWQALDAAGVALQAVWIPGGAVTDFNRVVRARRRRASGCSSSATAGSDRHCSTRSRCSSGRRPKRGRSD